MSFLSRVQVFSLVLGHKNDLVLYSHSCLHSRRRRLRHYQDQQPESGLRARIPDYQSQSGRYSLARRLIGRRRVWCRSETESEMLKSHGSGCVWLMRSRYFPFRRAQWRLVFHNSHHSEWSDNEFQAISAENLCNKQISGDRILTLIDYQKDWFSQCYRT